MIALLSNRNFSLFYFGQMLSRVGNNLFFIALFWFVLIETNSKMWLTWTGLAESVPGLLALFVGVWVDRWPNRWTMLLSDLIRLIIMTILFVCSVLLPKHILIIVILFTMIQIVGTIFEPASMSILPDLVPKEQIGQASGLIQSGGASAQLLGQVGGGAIISFFGAPPLFLFNTLTFGASVLSLLFMKGGDQPRSSTPSASYLDDWKRGINELRRSSLIFRLTFIAVILNLVVAPIEIVFPVWVHSVLRESATVLGILYGFLFGGMLAGGLIGGYLSKRLSGRHLFVLAIALSGISLGTFGLSRNAGVDAALTGLFGVFQGAMNTAFDILLIQTVDQATLGRVFSLLAGVSRAAMPLGIALAGLSLAKWPMVSPTIMGMGLVMLFSVIGLLGVTPRKDLKFKVNS